VIVEEPTSWDGHGGDDGVVTVALIWSERASDQKVRGWVCEKRARGSDWVLVAEMAVGGPGSRPARVI